MKSFNEEALKIVCSKYRREQANWDSNICWFDSNNILHRQVNSLNGRIYYVSKRFTSQLANVDAALRHQCNIEEGREHSKRLDEIRVNSSGFREEPEKEIVDKEECKNRESFGGRVNAEYEVNIDSYLTEFEADTLSHWADSKFISTKHIISECESRYIDKYTTAYNSEIMRAIMSHE